MRLSDQESRCRASLLRQYPPHHYPQDQEQEQKQLLQSYSPQSVFSTANTSQPFTSPSSTIPTHTHGYNQPLMHSAPSTGNYVSSAQLTPARSYQQRESSLSTIGSPAAPPSPFAPSTSNPHVVGDSSYELLDYHQAFQKSMTPIHTPLQAHLNLPSFPNLYQYPKNIVSMMTKLEELPRSFGGSHELMAAPELLSQRSDRPLLDEVASHDSPSTPTSHEDERHQSGMNSTVASWLNEYSHLSTPQAHKTFSPQMPKLNRTTTDAYDDELYLGYPTASTPSRAPASTRTSSTPANDIFTQRLQAANHQHLTSKKKKSSALSCRERSPFQPGSPLAPSTATFNTQTAFGSATRMRQEQKAKDALSIQEQYARTNAEQVTPKTISPKDVDLVYREEDDADMSSFPPLSQEQQGQLPMAYPSRPLISQEAPESEDMPLSQQSYASMATTRRESSSAYSTNSPRGQFTFGAPSIPGNIQPVPQLYSFVPSTQRQTSNMSNVSSVSHVSNDIPASMTSTESSSSSDYSPEQEIPRPLKTSANVGTYTCTYHGCTLRFDTPTQLQKHKREGHRNSTSSISNMGGENRGAMTSMARKLNSQCGPHKCTQLNPSTNKPCNIVFSRPYDLTRHEGTIHRMKEKLRCEYCTDEKTFSRNDALSRHMRVIHPEIHDFEKGKKKNNGY
ncbi:hypothetical protein DSL72_007025 [Monilinia vaccinii-corymbosi]|uniref:C2H2-type domain-containing protein n=1 Tax=Monilinia vaccinii-corymbosi TaxID=61207 RepID=A0A8A3PLM6_9HELO|nr:hypothetical protein DSL72_007025 [Monilinia vaccinii-corymbosi]